MQIDVSRFRAAFYVEAEEHLEHMEAALLQLESEPNDNELLNTIFRAAHSIKGASLTFGIDEVGKFTHVLESVLDRLRDGKIATSSELVELLLSSIDVLEGLIANSRDGAAIPEQLDAVFAQLQLVNNEGSVASPPTKSQDSSSASNQLNASAGQQQYHIEFHPSRQFFRFGQDAILLLRELSEMGTCQNVKLTATDLPAIQDIDPEVCYVGWQLDIATAQPQRCLEDVFMFLDAESRLSIAPTNTLSTEPAASKTTPTSNSSPSAGIDHPLSTPLLLRQ